MERLAIVYKYRNSKTQKTGTDYIFLEKGNFSESQMQCVKDIQKVGLALAKMKGFDESNFVVCTPVTMGDDYKFLVNELRTFYYVDDLYN